jgi:hypothetical protein
LRVRTYLEHNVLLEDVLDARNLVFGLALRKLERLGAAVEGSTVGRECGDGREFLRIGGLSLGRSRRRW